MKGIKQSMLLASLSLYCLLPSAYAADKTWNGNTSADWATAANWNEAVRPCATDTVFFTSGSNPCAGYDASTTGLTALIVGANYSGNLGTSSANPLKFSATRVLLYGGGAANHLGSGTTGDWDELVLDTSGSQVYTFVGENGGGFMPECVFVDGALTVDSGIATTLYVEPRSGDTPELTLSTPTFTNVYILSANATMTMSGAGTITNLYMLSGTTTITAGTVTNTRQFGGAIVWNTTSTATSIEVFAGSFDFSGDFRAKTVTTFHAHTASTIDLSTGIDNITFTNTMESYGEPAILTAPLMGVEVD